MNLGPFKIVDEIRYFLFWDGVTLSPMNVDPPSKILGPPLSLIIGISLLINQSYEYNTRTGGGSENHTVWRGGYNASPHRSQLL